MKELLEKNGGFFLRFETFAEIWESLENLFSPTAQAVIKTSMGKLCGERSYHRIARKIGSKREALQYLSQWKSQENWGELSFHEINFERKTGKIIVKKSFETRPLSTSYESSQCHFFNGFFRGFLTELFGKPIMVTEEKCVAKGDPQCEFRFAPTISLYLEEAMQTRDKIVQEMVEKNLEEGEE